MFVTKRQAQSFARVAEKLAEKLEKSLDTLDVGETNREHQGEFLHVLIVKSGLTVFSIWPGGAVYDEVTGGFRSDLTFNDPKAPNLPAPEQVPA